MEIIAHKTPMGLNKEVGYEPGGEPPIGGEFEFVGQFTFIYFLNNSLPLQESEKEYFNNLCIWLSVI